MLLVQHLSLLKILSVALNAGDSEGVNAGKCMNYIFNRNMLFSFFSAFLVVAILYFLGEIDLVLGIEIGFGAAFGSGLSCTYFERKITKMKSREKKCD